MVGEVCSGSTSKPSLVAALIHPGSIVVDRLNFASLERTILADILLTGNLVLHRALATWSLVSVGVSPSTWLADSVPSTLKLLDLEVLRGSERNLRGRIEQVLRDSLWDY